MKATDAARQVLASRFLVSELAENVELTATRYSCVEREYWGDNEGEWTDSPSDGDLPDGFWDQVQRMEGALESVASLQAVEIDRQAAYADCRADMLAKGLPLTESRRVRLTNHKAVAWGVDGEYHADVSVDLVSKSIKEGCK